MVDHIAHMVQNSSFYIQRKCYSENHFHFHRKIYYNQKDIFIFRELSIYSKKFSIFTENVNLKKFFTFRKSFFIYRNCIFSEK